MTLSTMTFEEVQSAMHERGTTPSRWAYGHGYSPGTVIAVIRREVKGPKSSEIARALQAFLEKPVPAVQDPPHSVTRTDEL